jgi:hypothetical protein
MMKGFAAAPPDWDGASAWVSQAGFLFDPVRGLTYSMNDTGSFIYQMLSEGRGLLDVIEAVVARFDVDLASARRDVEDFLTQMREAGLE